MGSAQAWRELQIPRQAEMEMLTLLFEVPEMVTGDVELAVVSITSGIPVARVTRVTRAIMKHLRLSWFDATGMAQ